MSNYAVWPFVDDPSTEDNLAEKECQKIGLSLANSIDPLGLAALQELSSIYLQKLFPFLFIKIFPYNATIFFKGVK